MGQSLSTPRLEEFLFRAAQRGDLTGTIAALDLGADPNAVHPVRASTALHFAMHSGDIRMARALLARGAAADGVEAANFVDTPLSLACRAGNMAMVVALCEFGVNVDLCSRWGNSAVLRAAEYGHVEVVSFLLERKARVTGKDGDGMTALTLAARNGHPDVIRLLLSSASGIAAPDINNALLYAAVGPSEECAALLLERGADVNVKDFFGNSPLLFAAQHGRLSTVKTLLRGGAFIEDRNRQSETALILAARFGSAVVVEELCRSGANVMARDEHSQTAILKCPTATSTDCLLILIRHGANILDTSNTYDNILHVATMYGNSDFIAKLESSHPNHMHALANARPLRMAELLGKPDVVGMLSSVTEMEGGRLAD